MSQEFSDNATMGAEASFQGRALASRLSLYPNTITILGTYRCTAMCENCCFDSNPWITERLDLDTIISFIDEASNHAKLVVFSGGECFLLGDDLVAAIAFAKSKGLATRCVTNGYWAKSLSSGRRRLAQLKEAGLDELNVSTGDFHQKYVSEETVVNALCLSVEAKMRSTLVVVELRSNSQVALKTLLENPRVRVLDQGSPENGFRMMQSPWMPMDVNGKIEQPNGVLFNRHNLHLQTGCDSIFTTTVLTPAKTVGLCCGLTRERIPELNARWVQGSLERLWEESLRDFIKIWIFVEGPTRVLAWASSIDPSIQWEDRYAHRCHSCWAIFEDPRVREVVRGHYQERLDSVLLRYSSMLRRQELLGAVYG